jgi:hypothetical protein
MKLKIKILFIKLIKWILIAVGILIFIFAILFFMFGSEAKNQTEFDKKKSAGNCRILNTAFAYDNNYKFEIHSFIQKVTPTKENGFKEFKKLIHLYAVDENNRIYDVSNGENIQNMSYEDYFKLGNYVYDELLVSGEMNKNHFYINFEFDNIIESPALGSFFALSIYYFTYKIYR